uniref:G-protein coupled receptors family 1 profile domain-containing protein n=1 Tax=Nothobranchius furzeri TaxID=105023 RepID=A0A8C6NR46_NOTFU
MCLKSTHSIFSQCLIVITWLFGLSAGWGHRCCTLPLLHHHVLVHVWLNYSEVFFCTNSFFLFIKSACCLRKNSVFTLVVMATLQQSHNLTGQSPGLSRAGHTAAAVVLGSILVLGFLGNFLVLLVFSRFPGLRTPVGLLLINISISDMLVCLFGTPLSFAASLRGRWLTGTYGCRWYGFCNALFGNYHHHCHHMKQKQKDPKLNELDAENIFRNNLVI